MHIPAWRRRFFTALLVLGCSVPSLASAQMRVFEENRDDAVQHRWLDFTGFVQPGFILRTGGFGFTDAETGERLPADPNAGNTDSGPWVQRARIGLRAQLAQFLRFRVELEMAPVPSLQDAFLDVPVFEWLSLRAGQFIVPFLRTFQYNELNLGFIDRAVFTPINPDRTFIRYLSPRDVGFMVSGRVGNTAPESTDPVFEYQIAVMNGRGANIVRNDDQTFLYSAHFQLNILGLARGADIESDIARNTSPRVAVATGFYSNCDDRENWNRGFTFDTEFRFQGFFAHAALVWLRNSAIDPPGGAFNWALSATKCKGEPAPSTVPGMMSTLDFASRGLNLQLQYVLPEEAFPVEGQDLEVLFRADYVDPRTVYNPGNPLFGGTPPGGIDTAPPGFNDSDNPPSRWRITLGLNWFPTGQQKLRVSFNYQINREDEPAVISGRTIGAIANDIAWLQLTAGL